MAAGLCSTSLCRKQPDLPLDEAPYPYLCTRPKEAGRAMLDVGVQLIGDGDGEALASGLRVLQAEMGQSWLGAEHF